MKLDPNLAGFYLALISAVSGWTAWWLNKIQNDKTLAKLKAADEAIKTAQAEAKAAEAATKAYAAQRDFTHINNNLKQLDVNLEKLFSENDRRFDSIQENLIEIKIFLFREYDKD